MTITKEGSLLWNWKTAFFPKSERPGQPEPALTSCLYPEIFEKTRFSATEVKSRLHETAYLNPQLTISFEDRRGETLESIEYHEPEGIIGFIRT